MGVKSYRGGEDAQRTGEKVGGSVRDDRLLRRKKESIGDRIRVPARKRQEPGEGGKIAGKLSLGRGTSEIFSRSGDETAQGGTLRKTENVKR